MCTGRCSQCLAVALYPTAFTSILCNILLFFPNWDVKYAREGHLTEEVLYMGGLVGGGIMVLASALYIHQTGVRGCCANRCGMFISIAFAAVGVVGALYSFLVAFLALQNGPTCYNSLFWGQHFKDSTYLKNPTTWGECSEPKNVVVFNTGLFATLLATSALQMLLCAIQVINGLVGCVGGTCLNKGPL
ncbi:transmembrane 4 L6 family member 4 [Genypterus blacodes]|uniref:transmembrane 4 L6 family member 4 n=1 Tax=Genypterus blacodes TaxID=154954 RepID=UPI003F768A26